MKFQKLLLALLCLVSSAEGFSQEYPNEYVFGKLRSIHVTEGVFYDNGGKDKNLINEYFITTIHGEKTLDVFFDEFSIPDGALLKVYKGKDNSGELLGVFRDGKIANIKGQEITFEYIPAAIKSSKAFKFKGFVKTDTQESSGAGRAGQPASDCVGAIPLCQNLTAVALGGLYTDLGAVNDDNGTCYGGTGSGGSVWYSFQPQNNGPLDFTITPTGNTDYDFVLWDVTSGCGTGQRKELSCNFSQFTGGTGVSSVNCNENYGTCSTNDCTIDSKGSDCNRYNRRPTVASNRKYAVCINFYSGSNDGFTIQFKKESSSVNITDITPPEIINSIAGTCPSASQFEILFSEYVDCSTIQASDFTLPGHTVTLVSNNCISNSGNSVTVSVSPPLTTGTYALHAQDILDLCGNNMNSNFNIVIGASPTATASSTGGICRSPGFLGIGYTYTPSSQTLTATGGSFYKWSDGQTGASISVSPITTTTYTVTVTQGACPATASVVVPVEDAPVINIPDQNFCAGESKTLTATGGGTYQWYSNPSLFGNGTAVPGGTNASLTVSPTATITYRVVVTSPAGCKGQDDVKLTLVTTNCCNASIAPAGPFCTADAPKTLTAGTSGGTWSGTGITNASAGTFSPSVSGAGSFKVIYTLSCGSSDSIIITVQTCTSLSVCRETNGNLTASGGIAPYIWEKDSTFQNCSACLFGCALPPNCAVNQQVSKTFATGSTITPPGTYPIRVKDNSGSFITITSLASVAPCANCPTITVTVQTKQNVTCASATSGSATFTSAGGTGTYTYVWSPSTGSTTASASNLAAGTYNVTATDANGCTGTGTVTINPPATPTLSFSNQTNPTCGQNNGSVSVTLGGGTAPYVVTIDNGQGSPQTQNVPVAGTAPVGNLAAGTYTITVRDANNCTVAQTLTLTPPNSPTINPPVVVAEVCSGQNNGSLTSATTTGGTGTMQWNYASAATPGSTTVIAAFPVNNLAPGNYILNVRDANNCTATTNFTIAAGPNCCSITLSIATVQPNCGQSNGSITVTPSPAGNYTYAWSNSLPAQATQSNLASGPYSVTVSETGNPSCNTDTIINLNNSNGPSITFSNKVEPGCNTANGSVNVTLAGGTAPYTVTVDNGSGTPQTQVIPSAGTAPLTGLAAGNYIISVTDANSCSATQTIVFTEPSPPVIISINATAESCFGDNDGTASVSVIGGTGTLTYLWSNSGTNFSITGLAPNTYFVTITDALNCSTTGNVTVSAGPVCCTWNISAALVQPSCGANDGSINLTVLPAANYTYAWDNSVSTANNPNLGAGTYRVTITNTDNNCVEDTLFSLSNSNAPTVSNVVSSPETCAGNDGAVSITASGGTGTLSITWSNGGSGSALANLPAGTYNYTVTDANNCQATGFLVVAPATGCCNLQATATATDASCAGNDGSIQASVTTAGTPPYQYSMDGTNYQASASFNGLAGGVNHDVYVMDADGCKDTLRFIFVGQAIGTISVGASNMRYCEDEQVATNVTVSGANGNVIYLWSNGETGSNLTNPVTGSYSLTVTDAQNCTATTTFSVNVISPYIPDLGEDIVTCRREVVLCAPFNPEGDTVFYWSNGVSNRRCITVNQSGVYIVTAYHPLCPASSDTINVTFENNVVVTLPTETVVYEGNPFVLKPSITGATTGATYQWQPSEGLSCDDCANPVANPDDTITYSLVFTDANGCSDSASTTINVLKGALIYMPNVFSPNHDGSNDILFPLGVGVKSIKWKVFNRWGELVFTSEDVNIGWDGTFGGALQPAGVYVYTMQVTFFNKTARNYKGSFTLIR